MKNGSGYVTAALGSVRDVPGAHPLGEVLPVFHGSGAGILRDGSRDRRGHRAIRPARAGRSDAARGWPWRRASVPSRPGDAMRPWMILLTFAVALGAALGHAAPASWSLGPADGLLFGFGALRVVLEAVRGTTGSRTLGRRFPRRPRASSGALATCRALHAARVRPGLSLLPGGARRGRAARVRRAVGVGGDAGADRYGNVALRRGG